MLQELFIFGRFRGFAQRDLLPLLATAHVRRLRWSSDFSLRRFSSSLSMLCPELQGRWQHTVQSRKASRCIRGRGIGTRRRARGSVEVVVGAVSMAFGATVSKEHVKGPK